MKVIFQYTLHHLNIMSLACFNIFYMKIQEMMFCRKGLVKHNVSSKHCAVLYIEPQQIKRKEIETEFYKTMAALIS